MCPDSISPRRCGGTSARRAAVGCQVVNAVDCLVPCLYSRLMAGDQDWFEDVAFPALLRAARTAYGSAIRTALADMGCDDVPRNGSYVIGAIARTGAPLSQIIR